MLHKGIQGCGRTLRMMGPRAFGATIPARNFFHFGRRQPWGLVDVSRQMEDMSNAFARMERDMAAAFRDVGFGRFTPSSFSPSTPSTNGQLPTAIEGESTKGGKYTVKMDLGKDFNPENVKVSLKDRVLTIEAKHEYKSEDGKSRMYQEFFRSFTLPQNVKVEEVKSLFTPEGELLVEAPLPQVEAPKPKEIPVTTFESPAAKPKEN